MEVQVECITLSGTTRQHEHITNIGGTNPDKKRWNLPLNDAIVGIENKTYKFFVLVGGQKVWVEVVSRNGRKYLRTIANGKETDNLLSLPNC